MIDIGLEFEVGETEDDLEFDAQDYVGLSAYQIAVKHGYEGTEEQWIASISKTKTSQLENDGNGKSPFATEAYVNEHSSPGGTTDYNQLINKPKINGVELSGEVELAVPHSTSELNNDGDGNSPFATKTEVEEAIAAVPAPKVPTKTSELENDGDGTSSFATQQDVADAAKDKLTIVTNTTTATKAYVAKTDGSQGTIDVATGVAANTLAQRDADGRLQVGAATADNDAVNLAYANAHYLPSKEVDKTSSSNFFTSINAWTGKIQYSPATFDEWNSDLKYEYRFGVVTRDFNGVIYTGNFAKGYTTGYEVPNKKYVDAADNKIKDTVSKQAADIELLYTLIENTIITNTTVEDTYTSRVTAGGLPVVSNTPTTVHKIAGDTKASENLFDLSVEGTTAGGLTYSSANNTFTFSGELTADYVTIKYLELPRHLYGKTITFSQSKYFNTSTDAGAIVWKIGKTVDGVYSQLGTTFTNALTVTFDDPNAIYKLYIQSGTWKGQSIDGEETISFMANLGETALPYSDYYAGLKNAFFKGVTSTGSNLVDIYGLVGEGITKYGVTIAQEQDGYLHFSGIPTGSYRVLFTISQDLFQDGETYTFAQSDYFGAYGSAYKNKNAVYWKVARKNLATGEMNYALISTDAISKSVTFDKTTYSYNIDIVTGSYAYTSGDEMDVSLRFWINRGSTALPYEDYTTDTSFQLSVTRQLRKWDYIDVDNQRLVTGTAEVTQETEFTDEELATYPAEYILSADRKTIAYPLETPTTAALTVPKTYTAWRNGSETVDTGAADALPPTITQTYYEEVASHQ